MRVQIFKYEQKEEYDRLIEQFSIELDIYYDFDFLICDADLQGGTAEVFVAHTADEIMVYPYIRAPFKEEKYKRYSDALSPYGYAGPAVTTNSDGFFDKAENALINHFVDTGTVTEFVRYHFTGTRLFRKNITNEDNRTIIILPLDQPWATIWEKEFSAVTRRQVRKLIKDGFIVEKWEQADALPDFITLYNQTMDNAGASGFYYLELEFLKRLKNRLGENLKLYRVEKNGITYASAFLFFRNGRVTYYFSARNLQYSFVPATKFLLAQVAEIAWKSGNKYINFGGGLSNLPNDSLQKFKLHFSHNTTTFRVGKRIHLPDIYRLLKQDYIAAFGQDKYEKKEHILQFYRM